MAKSKPKMNIVNHLGPIRGISLVVSAGKEQVELKLTKKDALLLLWASNEILNNQSKG